VNSTLAAVALASIAAGGVAYVFIYPLLSGEARAEKRQKALVPARSARA
jgi:tight adherence protein B